jgi:uncharacterized protein YyaL (SSP411 family)
MNRLSREPSLYLRQHAENPVHWHPWDAEALQSAREQGRPILLSVGYSACHWCHVMAHESFEDKETAQLMNRLFVNIKVDREERPDLDRIYQLAHQLLTGRGGGWPLTVFLDPRDLVPFFAGTYFPPQRRYGMPAFAEVLQAVAQWFEENPDDRQRQAGKLRAALATVQGGEPGEPSEPLEDSADDAVTIALGDLRKRFDEQQGGFGGPPRFPQAPLLEAVAMLADDDRAADAGRMLEFTLKRMARSGLRDHLDGGFFRYCVDGAWAIPHFEKMLYDNAMLLPLYAEGAARWKDVDLQTAAEGVVNWLQSTMRQPSGGYAASIDADADGEEGGFHVWSAEAVEAILDADDWPVFQRAYGLDQPPNFEGRDWHLQRLVDTEQLTREFEMPIEDIEASLAHSGERLRNAREARAHPTLDDKQLTSWNALLAGGFVRAAVALQREVWLDHAEEIFRFLRRELWADGRLSAVFNANEARFSAYLDDYAWLLEALLDYLAVRWDRDWLEFAVELAEGLLQHFEDPDQGGFYFSDVSVQVPMMRSMNFHDDATPNGNGVAIMALSRLGRLLGEPRFAASAERCLARAIPEVRKNPLACATVLRAWRALSQPRAQVILAGQDPDALGALKRSVEDRYRLDCYEIGGPDETLPGILGGFRTTQPATAWLCRGMACLPPVHSMRELQQLMTDH